MLEYTSSLLCLFVQLLKPITLMYGRRWPFKCLVPSLQHSRDYFISLVGGKYLLQSIVCQSSGCTLSQTTSLQGLTGEKSPYEIFLCKSTMNPLDLAEFPIFVKYCCKNWRSAANIKDNCLKNFQFVLLSRWTLRKLHYVNFSTGDLIGYVKNSDLSWRQKHNIRFFK